jgi:hypothetical protein
VGDSPTWVETFGIVRRAHVSSWATRSIESSSRRERYAMPGTRQPCQTSRVRASRSCDGRRAPAPSLRRAGS